MNKSLLIASILLSCALTLSVWNIIQLRRELDNANADRTTLIQSVETLTQRTGVTISLAPEIKATAVLGKVSHVSLDFKPADIVAALQQYRDTLPRSLVITQK